MLTLVLPFSRANSCMVGPAFCRVGLGRPNRPSLVMKAFYAMACALLHSHSLCLPPTCPAGCWRTPPHVWLIKKLRLPGAASVNIPGDWICQCPSCRYGNVLMVYIFQGLSWSLDCTQHWVSCKAHGNDQNLVHSPKLRNHSCVMASGGTS
jgi:hypothetical protein